MLVALWSAEVLHTLRLRTETLRSLCPDPADAFTAWWSGHPPIQGATASIIVFDPTAAGRQRTFCDLNDALRAKPRYRGYADAAEHLSVVGR